jgi:hypothetical protein
MASSSGFIVSTKLGYKYLKDNMIKTNAYAKKHDRSQILSSVQIHKLYIDQEKNNTK